MVWWNCGIFKSLLFSLRRKSQYIRNSFREMKIRFWRNLGPPNIASSSADSIFVLWHTSVGPIYSATGARKKNSVSRPPLASGAVNRLVYRYLQEDTFQCSMLLYGGVDRVFRLFRLVVMSETFRSNCKSPIVVISSAILSASLFSIIFITAYIFIYELISIPFSFCRRSRLLIFSTRPLCWYDITWLFWLIHLVCQNIDYRAFISWGVVFRAMTVVFHFHRNPTHQSSKP